MKINRHNYEEFLLDFIEGNLSVHEVETVQSFLDKNSDIKAETEDLLSLKLDNEDTKFENKKLLKKDPEIDIEGISKFERLSVAFLENDITNEENLMLDEMLKQSEKKQHEHQLIQQSKLTADEKIDFQNKSKLKQFRLTNNRRIVYFVSSLAASVALLISIFLINSENEPKTGFALNYSDLDTPTIRQYTNNHNFTESKRFVIKTNFVENNMIDTTTSIARISESIESIESKQAFFIESTSIKKQISHERILAITYTAAIKSKVQDEVRVEDYVNSTLQELGLEKRNNKKPLLARAGKSVAQFFGNLFKKNIQVKKIDVEDGRKLYAVRAGSLEFYTNVKSRKSKDKKAEEDEIINNE